MSTSNENGTKPIDHGDLQPLPVIERKQPYVPPILRDLIVVDHSIGYEAAVEKFGKHKCRVLRGTTFYGRSVNPGDLVTLPGNIALLAVRGNAFNTGPDIEFVGGEARVKEEQAVIEAARKLNMRPNIRDLAEFKP